METTLIYQIFFVCFGMLIGSFLNVVIYRLPRELSVVAPRSSCPKCSHMITWYENIPVVSYLFLQGKCKKCSIKISKKYPLIEILIGCIAYLLTPKSLTIESLVHFSFYFSLCCVFICHFFIDIEHHILPDKLNIYLLFITLPYVFINFPLGRWLLGGLVGFGGPFVVTYLFYKLRGQIGLGGGDIKLFGILGLLLGPVDILKTVFFSCLLGSIIGVALIASKQMKKDSPLAFGPYILIAASLQIFFPKVLELIDPFIRH